MAELGGLTEKRGTDHCLWSKNTPPLPTSGHQHNLSTLSLCALQTWQPRREKDQTAAMEIVCSPPPPPHHTSSNPFQISTACYLYLPHTLILTTWHLKIWGWSNKIPQVLTVNQKIQPTENEGARGKRWRQPGMLSDYINAWAFLSITLICLM